MEMDFGSIQMLFHCDPPVNRMSCEDIDANNVSATCSVDCLAPFFDELYVLFILIYKIG
jgi:hypothetical protein